MRFNKKVWALLPLAVLLSDVAAAAQWYAQPRVSLREEMDDNVTLSASDKTAIQGTTAATYVAAGARDELWDVGFDAQVSSSRFDEKGYNTDDQNVGVAGSYKGESDKFNLSARMIRDSTRESEVLTSGNIGLTSARRELTSVDGSWTHDLNDLNSIQASSSLSKTRYSVDTLTQYDSTDNMLVWIYNFDERFSLSAGPYVSTVKYLTNPFYFFGPGLIPYKMDYDSGSKTTGLLGRMVYAINENDRVDLTLGRGSSDTKALQAYPVAYISGYPLLLWAPTNDTVQSHVTRIDGNYRWNRENWNASVGLAQNTEGTSDGYVVQFKQATAEGRYYFTPRLYVRGDFTARSQSPLNSNSSSQDRKVRSLEVGVAYSVAEEWWADISVRRRDEDQPAASGVATSNAVLFGISYIPAESTWAW